MHRRCQSDAASLADVAASAELQEQQVHLQPPAHVRSISLGSSASHFLQSLKLEPAAGQHSCALHAVADQEALPDQHTACAGRGCAGPQGAAEHMGAIMPAGCAGAAGGQERVLAQPVRAKRTHRGSNGHAKADAMQVDSHVQEQCTGFTPLPAVVENSCLDSERDWDSDSDREGVGPHRRGSKGGGRRGGYNGRSERELLLLDPKRVKRILANRQSAARSKERRVNYTMELESKLQALSVQSDQLHSRLNSLNKQDAKLAVTKAELEQQVHGVQEQVSRVVADNYALMSAIFQLQAAMGMAQGLPDHIMPPGTMEAAASSPYTQSWQLYQQQCGASSDRHAPAAAAPKQPKQPKQRQRQHKQPSHKRGTSWGSSFDGPIELDLNDPAAAAAAPVAELPIRSRSLGAGSAGSGSAAAAAAPRPGPAAACDQAAQPAAAAAAAGISAAAAVPASQPAGLQASARQHQWHTGLGAGGGSSSSLSRRQSSGTHGALQHATPGSAAQVTATAMGTAAGAVVHRHMGSVAGSGGGAVAAPPPAAAAAAAVVAQPAVQHGLLGQMSCPNGDAVMADTDDDLSLLAPFLAPPQGPTAPAAHEPAGAAAACVVLQCPPAGAAGPGTHTGVCAATASAAAGHTSPAGWSGVASVPAGAAVVQPPAGWAGGSTAAGPAVHNSTATAAAPPAAHAAAGSGATFGCMVRGTPALSDPVAGEVWPDELSSGSMGGSLTLSSHTPTPHSRTAADAAAPAFAAPGAWQRQQQQQQQQVLGPGGANSSSHYAGASPLSVAAAAATAAGAPPAAAAGVSGVCGLLPWASGPPSGAGSHTTPSPLTPVSSRVALPPGGSTSGVCSLTGGALPGAAAQHAAALPGWSGQPAHAAVGKHVSWSGQQQSQQQLSGTGMAPAGFDPHTTQLQPPLPPPPQQQQSQQQQAVGSWRHIRSASTGCMPGLNWGSHQQMPTHRGSSSCGNMQQPDPSTALNQQHQHQQQQQQQTPQQQYSQQAWLQQGPAAPFGTPDSAGVGGSGGLPWPLSGVPAGVDGCQQVHGLLATSCEASLSITSHGPNHPASQRHRRSHSHAAAFHAHSIDAHYELSYSYQQQQQQQHVLHHQQQQGSTFMQQGL